MARCQGCTWTKSYDLETGDDKWLLDMPDYTCEIHGEDTL